MPLTNTIRILNFMKWQGLTLAVLLVLGVGVLFHYDAHSRMEIANRHFAIMDAKTIQEMKIIDFMDDHYWIAILYGAVFLGIMLWLDHRKSPRWIRWGAFFLLMHPGCRISRFASK